jgi:hypothetical protein
MLSSSSRLVLTLGREHTPLLEHADWIKEETLAVDIVLDGQIAIAKA